MMNGFFKKILYGGGVAFDLFKWIICVFVILILINYFLFTFFVVDGISMYPTMKDKEFSLMTYYRSEENGPKRGDVVGAKYPGDERKSYVKRVVGLPGEKIEVKEGIVFINDKKLDEKYLSIETVTEGSGVWQLKKDEYFLMGDNRSNSNDSRVFGPFEYRFIRGHARAILFPRYKAL